MISIDGQYLLRVGLGPIKDVFQREDDLIFIRMVEQVADRLPTLEIMMTVYDDNLLPYLNEGNVIKVEMGKPSVEGTEIEFGTVSADFFVVRRTIIKQSLASRTISIAALYNEPAFISDNKSRSFAKATSVDVLTQALSGYSSLSVSSTISPKDSQAWLQWGISDRAFVAHVLRHAYDDGSAILYGYTLNGQLKIRRLSSIIDKIDHQIDYDVEPSTTNKSAFLNSWAGYDTQIPMVNIKTGANTLVKVTPQAQVVADLNRSDKAGVKIQRVRYLTDQHAEYWKAFYRNTSEKVLHSQSSLTTYFVAVHKDVSILDSCELRIPDELASGSTAEHVRGIYIVSAVSRVIQNRSLRTYISLSREGSAVSAGGLA